MIKILVKITQMVYDKIHSESYKEKAKVKKENFSRKGKISFVQYVVLILTRLPRSLQAGLNSFCEDVLKDCQSYTKAAFSQGRQRIKPEAFLELFDMVARAFYQEAEFDTLKGYRVTAVDGTKYNLPNTPELKEIYGVQKTSGEPQTQALGSCLYDVLNGILLDVQLQPCTGNERELAVRHMEKLQSMRTEKEILLFDRGYPSAELLAELESRNFFYLMRCSSEFCKGMKISSDDCMVHHKFRNFSYEGDFRLVHIQTSENSRKVEEILITNLPKEEFSTEELYDLYHLRWGIETEYRTLKDKLYIENFSGCSDIAVRQDFYASMFLANMASIMIYDNREEIDKAHNNKGNHYCYKQNVAITIASLKDHVIEMVLTDSDICRTRKLNYIMKTLTAAVVPSRPGRSFDRLVKHKSLRFPSNSRLL